MEDAGTDGFSESEFTLVEMNSGSVDKALIFHVTKNVLSFILYMHQQIPTLLEDITREFNSMQTEFLELDKTLRQEGVNGRKQIDRKREIKQNIRSLEKLVKTISCLETALQLLISGFPEIHSIILALGSNSVRPLLVYELYFSHGNSAWKDNSGFSKSRFADGVAKKAVRALISKGAGSGSYPGSCKLFLMVKAPESFSLPTHFLPKRDFKYGKKVVPLRLQIRCRSQTAYPDNMNGDCAGLDNTASERLIWFQCRHVIKGLPVPAQSEECTL